jgi:hypothetical protein
MTFFSMRTRSKLWNYGLTAALSLSVVLIQTTMLSQFPVRDPLPIYCNLPLTLAIVWGAVYGSPLPPISPDELRLSSIQQIFLRQLAMGSVTGFLVGALLAAIYAPMLSVFPFYLPFAGWTAGYFSVRHINNKQSWLLCALLVFILSLLSETLMAWQLAWLGRPGAFDNLMVFALDEAGLNAIITPFIFFPLRRWYDLSQMKVPAVGR